MVNGLIQLIRTGDCSERIGVNILLMTSLSGTIASVCNTRLSTVNSKLGFGVCVINCRPDTMCVTVGDN